MSSADLDKAMQICAHQQNWTGMLEWGQRLLNANPDQPQLLIGMAHACWHLEDFAQAKSFLESAAKQGPLSADAQLLLGRVAMQAGNHDQAIEILQDAKKNKSVAPQASLLLAEIALQDSRLSDALVELEQCQAADPNRPEALRLLADVYFRMRQYDDFVNAVGKIIQVAGADDELRVLLGRALIQLGRLDPAMAELHDVLNHDQENALAWHWLGVAYIKKLQPALATEALTQSLELKSSTALAWHHLGVAWANGDDCTAAVEAFDQAISIDAVLARAHLGRAVCLARIGLIKDAGMAADRAIELDPNLADVTTQLANLWRAPEPAKSGRPDQPSGS